MDTKRITEKKTGRRRQYQATNKKTKVGSRKKKERGRGGEIIKCRLSCKKTSGINRKPLIEDCPHRWNEWKALLTSGPLLSNVGGTDKFTQTRHDWDPLGFSTGGSESGAKRGTVGRRKIVQQTTTGANQGVSLGGWVGEVTAHESKPR